MRERDVLLTCSPNGKYLSWFVAVTFDGSCCWTGKIGGQILGGWGRGRQWTRNRVVSRTNQRKLEHCIALVIKSTFFVCLWQCQESTRTDDDVDCKISFRVSFLTICFRKYKTDCGVCCASRQSQALFHLMRNTQKINAKSYLEEKRQFFLKFRAI